MTPAQLEQIIEYLAKSPFVQSEMEAAKVAIFSFAEAETKRAIPYGLRTISRVLRWIYIKCKRKCFNMAGTATITVNDGTNVLEGAIITYAVGGVSCEATTDSTGVATVTGLDAGNYDFTAALSGYTSASVTLAITDDTTTTGTISLTAETTTTTTEGESTVSTISDAATTAAETAAITSLVSTSTETTTTIADTINSKIKELTAEISTTSSPWVKVRNTVEIAALAGALAGIVAGLKSGIEELKDKIS
ncbi:MAG: putative invasin [Firmicutes bacterium]|nr:putative invasin [Bacillota bacterium]